MHHIDISVRLNCLPSKSKHEKNPSCGMIPNLTCRVSLPFHIHQHIQKVFPVCHVVQSTAKQDKTNFILAIDKDIEKNLILLYYSTSRTETFAKRNFGKNS